MSMLTPPGMGGKYRITGDRYPRMRRPRNRRRIVLAAVAAVTSLGLAGWGTLQLIDVFSGGSPASASSSQANGKACATEAKAQPGEGKPGESGKSGQDKDQGARLPDPSDITVNVLNATGRSGLAKSTADELKERGFRIGKVANAPAGLDKKVKPAGVLMGAPSAETSAALKVLGTQLKGADTRHDERESADVDLVIGDAYKKLTKKKDAEAALTALAAPAPSSSSSRCKN
ncbi:MAG: LytR C-terminal domain-containing protein [Streptomyces sp.]|uniref:LytR C-terminal domain-containing protein n=1 Tax=Streptomyces sp. TaxID=1931 RepID=UPI003D6ADD15